MTAKLIQVIETDETRGVGTTENPFRTVRVYYSPGGDRLAECDPLADERTASTDETKKAAR